MNIDKGKELWIINKIKQNPKKAAKAVNNFLTKIENIQEKKNNYFEISEEVEWMKKVTINIDWKEKEIFVDEKSLTLWIEKNKNSEKMTIYWIKYLINNSFSDNDGIKVLKWENQWLELFTLLQAKSALAKEWKRLPTEEELKALIEQWVIPKWIKLRDKTNNDYASSWWSTDEENAKKEELIEKWWNLNYEPIEDSLPHSQSNSIYWCDSDDYKLVYWIKDIS